MGYFAISGAGLIIAFIIHMAYSLYFHDGSPGPYPIPVQAVVGVFAFVPAILAAFAPIYGIASMIFGED